MPRIALAPLFLLWFGLGSFSRIPLIISLSFFIVAFNTYAGLQNVNRDHLLLVRTLGASRRERFMKFVLPSATPMIFNRVQLALIYAFLGAVVGEILSASQGLSGYLSLELGSLNTTAFFGALMLLVIVALIVSALVRLREKGLSRWYGLSAAAGPTPLRRLGAMRQQPGVARRDSRPPGGGHRDGLVEAFRRRRFWASNPFAHTAKMETRIVLPTFLTGSG